MIIPPKLPILRDLLGFGRPISIVVFFDQVSPLIELARGL